MPGVVSVVVLVSLSWGQAAGGEAAPITPEAIREAIGRLGAEEFSVRQAATDLLWRAGPAAEAELRAALKSSDPEVKNRAVSLLDKIRVGLRPDTPPEVQALIDQFRFGDQQAKQEALANLRTKGLWQVVLALLKSEPNLEQRKALAQAVAPEAGKLVRGLIEKGQLDEAENLLELTASYPPGQAQLAAFLVLTGRTDKHVARLREQLAAAPSDEAWQRLVMLLRASGDLAGAVAAAEKSGDKVLLANLLSEARDWKRVAPVVAELHKQSQDQLDYAAFAATYHRLAGNDAAYQEVLAGLRKAAQTPDKPAGDDPFAPPGRPARRDPFAPGESPGSSAQWVLAETLLVNEQADEAIQVIRESRPAVVLAFYRRTHRVAEALALAKIAAGKPLDLEWFKSLPATGEDDDQKTRARFALAADAALLLRELGQKEQLDQLLTTLHTIAAADASDRIQWAALVKVQWQLGRYDAAIADAAQLASGSGYTTLTALLKQQAVVANYWYSRQLKQNPPPDRKQALATAVWLAMPSPPPGKVPADWHKLVDDAAAEAARLDPKLQAPILPILGETCLVRGDRAGAKALFSAPAATGASVVRAGDIAAGEKDWQRAEELFRRAASGADGDPLATYLHGHALIELGQTEAGRKQEQAAALMALSPEARYTLAAGLQQRGLKEDAAAQFQLVQRTAPPESGYATSAAQQLGNVISGQDPLRAADCWEQLLLHVLNENSNFVDPEGYLSLPHVIHKARAEGLLAQGRNAEALAELAACERILPADVKLLENMVARLDKAGLKAEADGLFDRAYQLLAKICQDFPASALYLNNTAWISARARRQLEAALPLAQQATELAADIPNYWDTLAEVQFQRGQRAEAVAAATKARDLAPANPFYAQRLKHFQEGEPGKDDATEGEP